MTCFPPAMFDKLQVVYQELERELQAINPICTRRGDCCNFAKTDHVLYATPLEIAYTLSQYALPETPPAGTAPALSICPYLSAGRCGARSHRMLACRIYYCDPAYAQTGQELFEKYLRQIKNIYRQFGGSYAFVKVLDTLHAISSSQRTGDS